MVIINECLIYDNSITLKKKNNIFNIYLNSTMEHIGNIDYRSYHNKYSGDVGYIIFPKYRGNNYGYKSLELLLDYLYDLGINDIWLKIRKDNIVSNKIANKIGGNIIIEDNDAYIYSVETRKIMKGKKI